MFHLKTLNIPKFLYSLCVKDKTLQLEYVCLYSLNMYLDVEQLHSVYGGSLAAKAVKLTVYL